ncbi:Heparinase II/III N-terminus [Nonomuraea solani]|uniref:Heparinase II/III N-terminus n=1 Tax=Nonomuraea solani TaxID=1144553 RepID=A0A1H5YWP1_9ACTN|nr:heparinase II/III family protein [Nonomuraea solani]SEG27855.1 Heparinase II/III N-terminus [Nonomuraea solani]
MFWRARSTSGRAICLSDQFPVIKPEEVMKGKVRFVGLPAVDLGDRIDWDANPHGNRSWALNLHSLRWLGRLVAEFERSGERAYLDRAAAVADHWMRHNPRGVPGLSPWAWAEHAVALRAPALVCLSEHVQTRRLWNSLAEHGEVLADRALYREGHNHGLDQDIALLVVGCRLGRAQWRDLAIRRMTASAELAIDPQGALHEQAPRYGVYVHRRLGAAIRAIRESGAEPPERLVARRGALESYVAHATQPDGRIVPLGDSPADNRGDGFSRAWPEVGVFDAGYVFGRTAWDDPSSAYYSIRYGPGRRLHGHEDHLGVTYAAQGRRILVEAGFHSYERTGYVEWTRSHEAHNVPVVTGATFRPGTASELVSSSLEPSRQSYELADDAYGVRRTRHVLVRHGSDLMAVHDSVPTGTLRSLWHFDPAFKVVSRQEGKVVLGDSDGFLVTLLQFPGIGGVRPGLVSPAYLRTSDSITVLSAEAAQVLTVIVPGTDDPGPLTLQPPYNQST